MNSNIVIVDEDDKVIGNKSRERVDKEKLKIQSFSFMDNKFK
jgi:hypothetical protein